MQELTLYRAIAPTTPTIPANPAPIAAVGAGAAGPDELLELRPPDLELLEPPLVVDPVVVVVVFVVFLVFVTEVEVAVVVVDPGTAAGLRIWVLSAEGRSEYQVGVWPAAISDCTVLKKALGLAVRRLRLEPEMKGTKAEATCWLVMERAPSSWAARAGLAEKKAATAATNRVDGCIVEVVVDV
jgi:hypothetical protein